MKNVRELAVVHIWLFPVDAIPLNDISSPSGIDAIEEAFKFEQSGIGSPLPGLGGVPSLLPGLSWIRGEYNGEKDRRVVINSLDIQRRRIVLRISGTSDQADSVYEHLKSVISRINREIGESLNQVVYKAEESSCIVTLDFDFKQIFEPSVSSFLETKVREAASTSIVSAKVQPVRFVSTITYEVGDATVVEHGIRINPKEFIIEPRADTPLSEHRYLTKSPFRSDIHLEIVQDFEALFKQIR